jgi:hypothetical protein
MKTKTHFAFRVDIWDDAGNSIVEHVADLADLADGHVHLVGDAVARELRLR